MPYKDWPLGYHGKTFISCTSRSISPKTARSPLYLSIGRTWSAPESSLSHPFCSPKNSAASTQRCDNDWLQHMLGLMTEGAHGMDEFAAGDDLTFVTYNYDRIEHKMMNHLRAAADLSLVQLLSASGRELPGALLAGVLEQSSRELLIFGSWWGHLIDESRDLRG